METFDPHSLSLPLLPRELIVEILSWLPIKTLLRFRCVCKAWKSLISDPHFVKLHLQRSPKDVNLMLTWQHVFYDSDDGDKFRILFSSVRCLLDNPSSTIAQDDACYRFKESYWVFGSLNGLVCLRKKGLDTDEFQEYWVRLWNPATKLRSPKLPCLRVDSHSDQLFPTRFGFGYDSLSDTYKVAAILLNSKLNKTEVNVYNMGDNCWRQILCLPAFPFIDRIAGQFVSGTLNWLALRSNKLRYDWWDTVLVNQLVIFSLDMGMETHKQLLLPDGFDEVPYLEPSLGVLMGCLCLSHDYKRTHFVLWQMKEFGIEKSWSQLVNISYHHLQFYNFPASLLVPLCISESGDVVLMVTNEHNEATMYNLRDNEVQSFRIPGNKLWMDAVDYVQSLVLPC